MEKEIKESILKYLSASKYPQLTVLDNKYKPYYTGVTINYITYTLLKARYRRADVAKCLLDLHKDRLIKVLYCNDVSRIVFMNKNITYSDLSPGDRYGRNNYEYYANYMNDMIEGKKVNHKSLGIEKYE